MKILFIAPNIVGDKGGATAPPPGIAYIAANLLKHSHEVKIVDLRVEKDEILNKQIREFQPDYLGITLMSKNYLDVYRLVSRLKQEFNIPIIIGGPHVSTFGKRALEECKADYGIAGEGEFSLLELLDKKPIQKIKGLIWRNKNRIKENKPRDYNNNLDELPFPAYDIFPMERYIDKKIPLVTSRGCPYHCIYCAMKNVMGAKWRARSAENIFAEIKYWYAKGYSYFHITDDNFTLDIKRVEKLCSLIISSGIKIRFDLRNGIRVDRVTEQMLEKMKQAGCFYFAFGIEHFNDAVLKQMKKGATRKQALEAIQIAKKSGIPFGAFFMTGLPGDSYEKFLDTYKLAKESGFEEVRFYNVIPFPETELYRILKEKNALLREPDDYLNKSSKFLNDPLYELEGFSIEEKKRALELGQGIMMEKLFKKEFGKTFGGIAFRAWQNKFLRGYIKKPGIKLWALIRKSKRR